ncbi:hypothetical protein ACOMHN_033273 [Nucella lapillus]
MENVEGANRVNGTENMGPTGKTCKNEKRTDYLSWDEYFMAVAFLSAQRSKDPRTQVGACIVNGENKIVGIGYNGMPIGCSDDVMPWGRDSDDILERKHYYVCHAEMNAILNKNAVAVTNCRIYVALFPCNECTKLIIQAGIKEVIYCSDKYAEKGAFKASRIMMNHAHIHVRKFESQRKQVVVDFTSLDEKETEDDKDKTQKISASGATWNQVLISASPPSQGSASGVADQVQHLSVSDDSPAAQP